MFSRIFILKRNKSVKDYSEESAKSTISFYGNKRLLFSRTRKIPSDKTDFTSDFLASFSLEEEKAAQSKKDDRKEKVICFSDSRLFNDRFDEVINITEFFNCGKSCYGTTIWGAKNKKEIVFKGWNDERRKSLKAVNIAGCEIVPRCAFYGCIHLRYVFMGDTVMEIDKGAFFQCNSLTDIQFSKNLQSIGKVAFWKCTSLESLCLPPSCKEVGDNAFGGCSKLSALYIPPEAMLGKKVIRNCNKLLQDSEFEGYYCDDEVNEWLIGRFNEELPMHALAFSYSAANPVYVKDNYSKYYLRTQDYAGTKKTPRLLAFHPVADDDKCLERVTSSCTSILTSSRPSSANARMIMNGVEESSWGSYFNPFTFRWGYEHDHALENRIQVSHHISQYKYRNYRGQCIQVHAFLAAQFHFFHSIQLRERSSIATMDELQVMHDA